MTMLRLWFILLEAVITLCSYPLVVDTSAFHCCRWLGAHWWATGHSAWFICLVHRHLTASHNTFTLFNSRSIHLLEFLSLRVTFVCPFLPPSEIDFPKSSEAFVCFECKLSRVSWMYLMSGMEAGMRALPHANETYFRVNEEGILCIQHQVCEDFLSVLGGLWRLPIAKYLASGLIGLFQPRVVEEPPPGLS